MSTLVQSPAGPIEMVRAAPADAPQVLAIMVDAARWLAQLKIRQWEWCLTPAGVQVIDRRVAEGEVYLARLGGMPVGTVSLRWQDDVIWGERGRDGLAGYVHGLAIVRRVGGRGVGWAILQWSENMIAARGRGLARLDCTVENPQLCEYYVAHGYAVAGQAKGIGWRAQLFEKRLGSA
jgi:ribosomal protein S18 acetylase RimI-like enzyme